MEVKKCHLKMDDESVYVQYTQIWNKIKRIVGC